jgi:ribosomal protein S18 acetylase RimI-like enzyme
VEGQVRPGRPEDVAAAADVLAEAFTGYAWATWTVAADDHTERLRAQHELFLRRVLVPCGAWWVANADGSGPGRLVGVAAWLPPDADVPDEVWAELDVELAGLAGDRAEHAREAEAVGHALRPGGAHWYLATVGVLPAFRKRGLATALLAPGLADAAASGLPAYLETSSWDNVRLYEQLGFRVSGHAEVPDGGPDVWGMVKADRPPRPCARPQ